MGLPVRDQLKYWGLTAAILFILLWVLGDVLLPFVLGAAVAYFLDPVADRLEDLGASRVLATATITLTAILIFVLVALLVIPTLIHQTTSLFASAPQYATDLGMMLTERFPALLDETSPLSQTLYSVWGNDQKPWRHLAKYSTQFGCILDQHRYTVCHRARCIGLFAAGLGQHDRPYR